MQKEKAKDHFLGINGYRRLNCALSVAEAMGEKYTLGEEEKAQLAKSGGGRAPGSMCGALYAAGMIMNKYAPERAEEMLSEFASIAGSVKCREIRSANKLSCIDCVELAVEKLLMLIN